MSLAIPGVRVALTPPPSVFRRPAAPLFPAPLPPESIFAASMSSYAAPDVGSATLTFTRNFPATTLLSSGLYDSAAHNTAAYTWRPELSRNVYRATDVVTSAVSGASRTAHRDLSQAEWAKTNCAAVRNAVGITGAASSASTLTASGNNATCLYAFTMASAARTLSAFVRRSAGTGAISITRDGGSTWTDITSQITDTAYARVSLSSTVTNPSVGFRIETSGDAIIVDAVNDFNTEALIVPPLIDRPESQETSTLSYTALSPAPVSGAAYYMSGYLRPLASAVITVLNDSGTFNQAELRYNPESLQGNTFSNSVLTYNTASLAISTPIPLYAEFKAGMIFGGGRLHFLSNDQLIGQLDVPNRPNPQNLGRLRVGHHGEWRDVAIQQWTGHNVVLLGDSLTADARYPALFRAEFDPLQYLFAGRGQGGDRITDVTTRVAADTANEFIVGAASNNILLWIGTNTLADNVSAATALTQLQTLIDTIKAANSGWRIILQTVLSSRTNGLTGITAANFTIQANAFNAGMSTLSSVNRIINISSLPEVQNAADTTYYADGIHLNTAGYAAVFPTIAAALRN
jgi:lysophospholipase L1-like esterase